MSEENLGKFGKFGQPFLSRSVAAASKLGGWSCAPSPNLAENGEGSLNGL